MMLSGRMTKSLLVSFFFFNDTATTEIYTLSLHDALPISRRRTGARGGHPGGRHRGDEAAPPDRSRRRRSEEHTSELQSQSNLVCRLLLEKKKKNDHGVQLPVYGTVCSFSICGFSYIDTCR